MEVRPVATGRKRKVEQKGKKLAINVSARDVLLCPQTPSENGAKINKMLVAPPPTKGSNSGSRSGNTRGNNIYTMPTTSRLFPRHLSMYNYIGWLLPRPSPIAHRPPITHSEM